ncbi:MAG: hypothetical protein FJ225_04700 [Lentisphaerae bacterium]|nr:hypothetical protein [Lentisphaerota bacterium]
MAQDWDIKPRAEACRACDRPFEDGQVCFSALQFMEDGYARADYCAACWPDRAADAAPYSSWQGVFRLPPAAPEEALKKETAETLLRRLVEEDDERRRNVIFILAVMLERKRELAERDVRTRDDGATIRVYEHRRTGETFLIPDPHLKLDELAEVQQQVVGMLGPRREEAQPRPEPAAPAPAPSPDSGVPSGREVGLRDGFYSSASL